MPLEKKPFTAYDVNGKKADIFTVRLNKDERKDLEEIKEDLNIKSDSKALKIAGLTIGRNVLQRIFSRSLLRYLFKKDRLKLDDFKNF